MLYAIIGGSSSLGSAISKELDELGLSIVTSSSGRRSARVPVPHTRHYLCDVTTSKACDDLADSVFALDNQVTLVYFPALSINKMCHKLSIDEWNEVIGTSLSGAFSITSAFLKHMRKASFGRVIYIGSLSGRLGVPGTSAYSAAKEGIKGLSRVVANEGAAKNITSNYIEVGYMDAGLTYSIPPDVRSGILKSIPKRKFGSPSEITKAIIFLSESEYITGSSISITGGL